MALRSRLLKFMASCGADLQQMSSDLKALSRQLKATQRSAKNNQSGITRHLRCHATVQIACVIFALTAPRTDVALEFLKFKRRNKPDAEEWTAKHLLNQFNEFNPVEKGLMLDATDKKWGRHLATAKAWLRDQGLRDWVHDQNKNKGVAPANEHLWKENMSWRDKDHTGALRPDRPAGWKCRQVNQWILRWARRSRVLRGAFKDGERLPVKTLRAKVVNQKPSAPKRNGYHKTRPQN